MAARDEVMTPTQRGWRLGAVGIVAVLLAGGGWLVVTGLSHTSATADPVHSSTTEDVTQDVAVGLSRFPATQDGATAAAAAALAMLGQPAVLFDDARLTELADELFVAAERRPQVTEIAVARQGFARSGWDDAPPARRSYFSTPIAVRLTGWRDGGDQAVQATVQVWSVTVVTIGDVGGAVFTTSTVDLTADEGGRWWIAGLDTTEGPTPSVVDTPSIPGTYRQFLRDVTPLVPVPLAGLEVVL